MKNYKEKVIEDVINKKDIVIKFLGFKERYPNSIIMKKIDNELNEFSDYVDLFHDYKLNFDENYVDMIYSIGERFEDRIEEIIKEGKAFPAMVMDKIGIVTLDMYRKNILQEIYDLYGLTSKKIIYPGSKTHPVSFQKEIYDNLNLKTVKINEFYQLFPVKSVALRIILEKSDENKIVSMCDGCTAKCEFRKSELVE